MPGLRITIVIPAAGRSARFGTGDKLTAPLAGRPVIRHVAEAAVAAGLGDVVIVADSQEVRRTLQGVAVLFASTRGDSMGSSIAAGVAASPGVDGWMIWPGDMPTIRTETALRVARAFDPTAPALPTHGSGRGHPVLFPACFRDALEALTEDRGARAILGEAAGVIEVPVEDAGIHFDIDSPEDLVTAERLLY